MKGRRELAKLLVACKAARNLIAQSSKIDWDNEVTPLLDAAIKAGERRLDSWRLEA